LHHISELPIAASNTTQEIGCNSEKLLTLKEMSVALNVPVFAVRRAAKQGLFPTYKVGTSRLRARLSEVIKSVQLPANRGQQ